MVGNPLDILTANIFVDECKKIKNTLEANSKRSLGAQIFEMLLDKKEDELCEQIPQRMMMNTAALSIKNLLDASPYDAIRAIRIWSELITAACMVGDDMANKMEEDIFSQ